MADIGALQHGEQQVVMVTQADDGSSGQQQQVLMVQMQEDGSVPLDGQGVTSISLAGQSNVCKCVIYKEPNYL